MRKTILSFFAGISLVVLTAAATGVTISQPAIPKNTVVVCGSSEHCKKSILDYTKLSFQVKTVSVTNVSGSNEQLFIIMEKY